MGAMLAHNRRRAHDDLLHLTEDIVSLCDAVCSAGVPRFFRWLTERYPLTMDKLDGAATVEIDNLYLDMNGIIHNCTHANEARVTASEEEMIRKCFLYIERLVRIARPRKVLFMAIDGAYISVTQRVSKEHGMRTSWLGTAQLTCVQSSLLLQRAACGRIHFLACRRCAASEDEPAEVTSVYERQRARVGAPTCLVLETSLITSQ